eukprot:1900247-Prymnesium_polylepis.1
MDGLAPVRSSKQDQARRHVRALPLLGAPSEPARAPPLPSPGTTSPDRVSPAARPAPPAADDPPWLSRRRFTLQSSRRCSPSWTASTRAG